MRIQSKNAGWIYRFGNVKKVVLRSAGSDGSQNQREIPLTGLDYQLAKEAVLASPDIREDKVAQIKALVDAGSYKVELGDFAAKLLEKYKAYR